MKMTVESKSNTILFPVVFLFLLFFKLIYPVDNNGILHVFLIWKEGLPKVFLCSGEKIVLIMELNTTKVYT